MRPLILLFIAIAGISGCEKEDEAIEPKVVTDKVQQVQGHTIYRNKNGTISAVEFSSEGTVPASAKAFFEEYLKLKTTDEFKEVPHKSRREGFVHEHFDQYYKGVKVDGAGYNFHYKNGRMYLANGHYVGINDLNATPTISLEKALAIFLRYKEISKEQVLGTITELFIKEIIDPKDTDSLPSVELVYQIYLVSGHHNNNEVGYINAHSGEVVETEPKFINI